MSEWNPYLGGEAEENLRRRGPRWDDEEPDRSDEDDREEFEKDQLLGE
jgi:hypothetical protein